MAQIKLDKKRISELWISFTSGEQNDFSEIYRAYYKILYFYGMNFKISQELIRDIIQDLFVKLYSKPTLVKNPSTLTPFLLASMRNACINCIKGQQKHAKIQKSANFQIIVPTAEDLFEENEEQIRINLLVQKILAALTDRQREIIYLRFLYEMEYDDISEIMNISEQAARNLTHRAIEKIRKDIPNLLPILVLMSNMQRFFNLS